MLQQAIIVDIDGTLANSPQPSEEHMKDGVMDWSAWIRSTQFSPVNEWCREMVMAMALNGVRIIFLTARSEDAESRKITEDWLQRHVPVVHELYMRPENDFRHDAESKRDLFLNQIAPKYDVLFAIDDKRANCDLFRDLGIAALHCADY